MLEIVLDIPPMPCPRPRVTRYGTTYPKTYVAWKKMAEKKLSELSLEQLKGPLNVFCEFTSATRKSYTKKKRKEALEGLHWPSADCDNLGKSVCDALTKVGAWEDDSQCVSMHFTKRYGEADKILIRIWPANHQSATKDSTPS